MPGIPTIFQVGHWRQNEQAEDEASGHLQRFIFEARVLFRY